MSSSNYTPGQYFAFKSIGYIIFSNKKLGTYSQHQNGPSNALMTTTQSPRGAALVVTQGWHVYGTLT